MIRLDKQVPKDPYQLDLFLPSPLGEGSGVRCPKISTQHVPILTGTSTGFDTAQVPKMGHLIKQSNNKTEREAPTHQIFKKNKKIQTAINDMGRSVPNPGHTKGCHPELVSGPIPKLSEVEQHFLDNNYPPEEAKKFYNHYKALGWKIQGKTPIQDWKPLVEKWMTNAKKWDANSGKSPLHAERGFRGEAELQYLYDSFLENKKIFHHITTAHFDQLKLVTNDQTMQQASQERINQVSGTNQHSINLIWEAYLTKDPNNQLVQKDKPNVIALAKRIEVLKHFQQQKLKQP